MQKENNRKKERKIRWKYIKRRNLEETKQWKGDRKKWRIGRKLQKKNNKKKERKKGR